VWPDLGGGGGARALLRAVVLQGPPDAVRELVGYWQPAGEEEVVPPPRCFELDKERRAARAVWVQEDKEIWERIRGLLE
jgi:hypothetical protein